MWYERKRKVKGGTKALALIKYKELPFMRWGRLQIEQSGAGQSEFSCCHIKLEHLLSIQVETSERQSNRETRERMVWGYTFESHPCVDDM